MKAEHRKELETNALADWMGRVIGTLRSGSKNTYLVTGLVVLIAAALIGGWYLIRTSRTTTSALWLKLDSVSTPAELDQLAKDNRGTMVARAARFEEARALLAQGIQNLGAQTQHESALDNLERGRNLYEEMIPQSKDMPAWQREAMMGVATAEESLVGSVKNGSLDKAAEYYQRLADAFPDTFQGEAAKKRAEELRDSKTRTEIEKFYVALNKKVTGK